MLLYNSHMNCGGIEKKVSRKVSNQVKTHAKYSQTSAHLREITPKLLNTNCTTNRKWRDYTWLDEQYMINKKSMNSMLIINPASTRRAYKASSRLRKRSWISRFSAFMCSTTFSSPLFGSWNFIEVSLYIRSPV